jgi:hypothetical protein
MPSRRKIKVYYRKLGKAKAWGRCFDNHIEIDPSLKGKKHLEIMIHECLHFVCPELDEDEVIKKSILITNTLWFDGFRRADNDCSQRLQDGTK